MSREPVYVGKKFTIRFLEFADDSSPAGEFHDSLSDEDRIKLIPIWERIGAGAVLPEEMFRIIHGVEGIYEVKRGQIRIYCFFVPGGKLILAHGVSYKGKHRKADLKKAESYRSRYFAALEESHG